MEDKPNFAVKIRDYTDFKTENVYERMLFE